MSATKISDLLPIPEGTVSPHAYQIFGLEVGESDQQVLKSAVQATVNRLRDAKAQTDPTLWKKAAQLVQQARVTLADPAKKGELDARFGIVSLEPPEPNPTGPAQETEAARPVAKADPLAGILPPSNPLAAVTPAAITPAAIDPAAVTPAAPSQPAAMPPGLFGVATPASTPANTPPQQSPMMGPTAGTAPSIAIPAVSPTPVVRPVVRSPKRGGGRKRRGMGGLFFGGFMLSMVALIGAIVYFMIFGPGELAITSRDGEFKISTQPPTSSPVVVAPSDAATRSAKPAPRPPRDPVMGTMGGSMPPPTMGAQNASQLTAPEMPTSDPMDEPAPSPTPGPGMMGPGMPGPGMPEPGMMEPTDMTDQTPNTMQPDPDPVASTPESDPDQTEIAAAEAAIKRTTDSILAADWAKMKAVAEATMAMPMTREQKSTAMRLYELADLATYYHGGITRGLKDLKAGNDFEVTPDFRIVIVEVGEDFLAVQYDGKNRTFPRDEFPFPLAEKLASFAIDPGPTMDASRAAFQAIAPKTNDGYRDKSIETLRSLAGQVEGVDTAGIARLIESFRIAP